MNLICGINPVLEALAAGSRHFDRLLVVKGLRNRRISDAIGRASQLGVPLRFEPREALDRMAGGVPHQGLIAVVSEKALVSLEQLLEVARDPALVVVLDGIEDPRNLGAILRTSEAAGADGVVLPERHSAGLSETVARASAGGLEHVRVARGGNLVQALEAMKARGIWVVGFDAAGTERWDQVDCRGPVALVFGGEGKGLRRLVREHCDHLVSFPLFGHVASLNVSVAAGVALYEVIRQRGLVPSHVRPIPARSAGPGPQIVGPSVDDDEDDPGAGHRQDLPAAELGEDDEPGPEAGLVEIHEEAAWAGPTVLKPAGFSRRSGSAAGGGGRGPMRGRRRSPGSRPSGPPRQGGGDRVPPQAPSGAPPGAPPGMAPPREKGRRHRRRKGGRPGGPPTTPGGGSDAPPPPSPPAAGGESGGSGPPGDRPAGGGGRRRRRRRR
jgi:23S rRNA (guanosine2251-2'-O)-methyltransferase